MSSLHRLKLIGLLLFVVILVADLWSKSYMQTLLGLDAGPDARVGAQAIDVIPGFLAWQGTWNPGVTFGMFAGQTIFILILTGLATCALFVWFLGTRHPGKCLHIGLSLILAGAVGNLYDRIQWDKVRDFILIYLGDLDAPSWTWPNFNIADSGIVCGVILVLWDSLFGLGAKRAKAAYLAKQAAKGQASAAAPKPSSSEGASA